MRTRLQPSHFCPRRDVNMMFDVQCADLSDKRTDTRRRNCSAQTDQLNSFKPEPETTSLVQSAGDRNILTGKCFRLSCFCLNMMRWNWTSYHDREIRDQTGQQTKTPASDPGTTAGNKSQSEEWLWWLNHLNPSETVTYLPVAPSDRTDIIIWS